MVRALGVLAVAYLLGSLSFSYYIVRWARQVDVRSVGSGNAGATNVLRAVGKLAGLGVLLLDAAKGAGSVLLAWTVDGPPELAGAAAVAAVVGHVFPVYHGLRGGKGVATGAGAMAMLAPLALLLAMAIFVAVVAATRFVALGSVLSTALLAPLIYLTGRLGWSPPPPAWLLLTAATVGLLIVVKHGDNLRRLRRGAEARLGDPIERDAMVRERVDSEEGA